MKQMSNVYQLWGLPPTDVDWIHEVNRFHTMQHFHQADVVIAGLGAPREIYARLRKIVDGYGSKLYLWLPVFSELDDLTHWDELVDHEGRVFLKDHKEGFRFRCPNSDHNIDTILRECERRLAEGQFDGVFLDRVRYPSFQYGLNGVLGCFCDKCRETYRAMGLDVEAMKAARTFELVSFNGRRWKLTDPALQALLDARCDILTQSMTKVCQFFREKGYQIGLDLFAPSLGYFAGQDVGALMPLADFIKPMLYRRTDAPAGLPYEIRVMNETIGSHYMPDLASYVRHEIQRMTQVRSAVGASARILCGMEFNRVPPIAPVTPEMIQEDVSWLRECGAEGIVASWSLLSSPDENANALTIALNK